MNRPHPEGRTGYGAFARIVLMAVFALVPALHAGTPHLYRLVDLGPPADTSSRANAVNNAGWIAGEAGSPDGRLQAFVWIPGEGMRTIGTLGGGVSRAYDISDAGMAVGEAEDAEGAVHAFRWTADRGMEGLATPEHTLNSVAYAANGAGVAVGSVETPSGHEAVMWDERGMRILPRLPGEGYVQPLDVNLHGDVVGQIQTMIADDHYIASHAYYFRRALDAENLAGFDLLSPASGSAAVAINDNGQSAGYLVTGDARIHAVRFTRAGIHEELPDRNAFFSSVAAINGQGDLCGSFIPGYKADEQACVWLDGMFFNLNDVTARPEDWHLVQAAGINDRGQIVGYGVRDGLETAFLLEPVEGRDPGSWPSVSVRLRDMTEPEDRERILIIHADPAPSGEVDRVSFMMDGELLGTVYDPPYEWGWQGDPSADPAFHVVLRDRLGRIVSSPVSVPGAAAP